METEHEFKLEMEVLELPMTSNLKARLVPRSTRQPRWRLARMPKKLGQVSGQMCSTKALMPWDWVEREVTSDKTQVEIPSKDLELLKI